MNPELPMTPREAEEMRVTALLMGQLSAAEAAAVQAQIDADPELARLHAQLRRASELLREADAPPADENPATPLRLSDERRAKLLAHFQSAPASSVVALPPRDWRWAIPLALAAALTALVGGAVLMNSLAPAKRERTAAEPAGRFPQAELIAEINSPRDDGDANAVEKHGFGIGGALAANSSPAPITIDRYVRGLAFGERSPVSSAKSRGEFNRYPLAPAAEPAPALAASGGFAATHERERDKSGIAPADAKNQPIAASSPQPARRSAFDFDTNGSVSAEETSKKSDQQKEEPTRGGSGLTAADGSSTNTLSGTNTFTGSTSISGGTLGLDGARDRLLGSAAEILSPGKPPASTTGNGIATLNFGDNLSADSPTQNAGLLSTDLAVAVASESVARGQFQGDQGSIGPAPGVGIKQKLEQISDAPEVAKALPRDEAKPHAGEPAPEPQPEVPTSANAFSTFSLNVSDVAFKLAAASLEQGKMPEPATVRSEEFINAFDYRDPAPAAGAPLAFAAERAQDPFAQNRDLLRLSVKTAAAGREPGRPLNLVLLLDNSGSMERADRVHILREALRVLSAQLQPRDTLSVVTFARTPRLWADGVAGDQAGEVTARVGEITPEGGTDLAAALDLGYATALRHYQAGSVNRVVLLTDGAANLGDVNPDALRAKVEAHRQQGVALDCFGIGWEGYDDTVLEALSRHGDGRYGFLNTPEEAATEFAGKLAGALHVAAADVKVQVEFNPRRVTAYRQIGYAKHQLTKEQFRDNRVDAAELGAAESGNALYVVEVNPRGEGDLATVRVRFKVPGTTDYHEQEWTVPFTQTAAALEQASPALRLAGTASAFSEWLVASPFATEVTPDRLLGLLNGVPAIYGADPRPQKLEWMIRQAKNVSGR